MGADASSVSRPFSRRSRSGCWDDRAMHAPPANAAAPTRRPPWALAATLALLLTLSWWPALDRFATGTVDAALTRALAAFAVARGINGAISVAQSAEVAIEPGGVGVSLAPGEILDPVNDLVEQFSSLMLTASASLGLQKLLIGASGWWPLKLALSAAVLAWIALAWRGGGRVLPWVRLCALGLIALRLAVPLSALASEGVYRALLADEYERSAAVLDDTLALLDEQGEALRPPPPPPDASLLDRARALVDEAGAAIDVRGRLAQLEATATAATRHMVNLVAVFTVQTVLLPLGFLWLLLRGLRAAAGRVGRD
jgi:hypothetical protein